MFGTIRKHQKWLWIIIITVVVISFVVYFSPYQKVSPGLSGQGKINLGTIAGRQVSPEAYRNAQAEVYLRYFLNHGNWPDKDPAAKQMNFDEERETYYRLFALSKLEELNVKVSNETVGRVAGEILQSVGRGRKVSLDEFEKQVLFTHGMRREDFQRFLAHELALQQLIQVAGVAGTLVTPAEARALYRHEHEEITASLVVFPATNYIERVTVTPEALAQFFTNQLARYRIPERVQVSYVEFELTNYWAEAGREMASWTNAAALVQAGIIPAAGPEAARFTNLEAVVEAIYEQRGTNFYRDAKTPDEAKKMISEELQKGIALRTARKHAAEFASVLFDKTPVRAENLEQLAAQSNLTVRVTAPFDRENGPAELRVGPAFVRTAFALSEEDPLAEPVVGEDAVYVMAFHKRLPSEIPSFESIRDRVERDFKYQEALRITHQEGASFYNHLTNGLAQGRSFSSLCLEAQLKPILLPPFSRSTRSLPEAEAHVMLGLLQQVAFKVPPGKVSNFVPTFTGGFIVNVHSVMPVDEKRMEAELPAFLGMLQRTAQSEAFNAWLRKQAESDPGFRRIVDELARRGRIPNITTPET